MRHRSGTALVSCQPEGGPTPRQLPTSMRSLRKPPPLLSILAIRARPIYLVEATWVPPSARQSRPAVSMIQTSSTVSGIL